MLPESLSDGTLGAAPERSGIEAILAPKDPTERRRNRSWTSGCGCACKFEIKGWRGAICMCLAVPGRILSTSGDDFARMARVSFGGIIKEVSLAYVPEAQDGNYVLVHVGFAISVMDETEALKTWDILQKMGELEELDPKAAEA